MNSTITLTLIEAGDVAAEYAFTRPSRCIVGRAGDCQIAVPADALHQDISRHHCEFDIDPPMIRVFDLDSMNGTFVNGRKIGQKENPTCSDDSANEAPLGVELHPGDEVRFGQCTRILVSASPTPEFAHSHAGVSEQRFEDEEPTYDCYH
jgi:pSer/pThr/pTyr-binding forkhead associated (FHA) protein